MNSTTTASCYCGCATCVCGCSARVKSTIEYPPSADIVVASEQMAEIEKGDNLTMSGDVSSTDVVSSGFGGPWGFGGQASLKPAEVALISTNNPFNSTNFLRDALTHESLRAEIKSVDAKVSAVTTQMAAQESARLQRELDQIRADQSNSILGQILAAVTKTTPSA